MRITILIMTLSLYFPCFANDNLNDLCVNNFIPKKCVLYIEELLGDEKLELNSNLANDIYNQIETLVIKKFEVNNFDLKDITESVYIMDDFIYRHFIFSNNIERLMIKNKEGKYDELEVRKLISMYKLFVDNHPYSRYSSMLSLGVNYYSLVLCEINPKNCPELLPQAVNYVNKVISNDDESLKGKYYSSWMWFDEALFKSYLTNIFNDEYKNNEYIIEQITSYKYVVDKFGIVYYKEGIVPSSYVDQIHIGHIIPGRTERLGRFYSTDAVSDKLLEISRQIKESTSINDSKDIFLNKIKDLENNDYLIVLSSLNSNSSAVKRLQSIKKELSLQKYNNFDGISIFRDKLKTVPPKQGEYWGVGIGPVTKSETEKFKKLSEESSLFSDYYLDRPKVIGY